MKQFKLGIGAALVGVASLVAAEASADVTITVTEFGGDVVMNGSGTLDVSQFLFLGSGFNPNAAVDPDQFVTLGPAGNVDLYLDFGGAGFAGPSSIGSGTLLFDGIGTGDVFGIDWIGGALIVPNGYTSGDTLMSTATFSGESFASIGLIEGTYTWTWNTADGQGDSLTINIVPAPGALALLGIAGFAARRRRN